jgi:hypothetical protein
LTEDEDFIEVHYKGKQIGTFSKHNRKDLSAIEKFIEERKVKNGGENEMP